MHLPSIRLLAVAASLSLTATLSATPINLTAGSGAYMDDQAMGGAFDGTVLDTMVDSFSVLTLNGTTITGSVSTKVVRGNSDNQYGANALTFIYQIENNSDPMAGNIKEGILNFFVGGWAGVTLDVGMSSALQFASANTIVLPGQANRSGDGSVLDFTFPPDPDEPPIFAGEVGYTLIVYSSAVDYTTINSELFAAYVNTRRDTVVGGTETTFFASTFTAAASAVPEHGVSLAYVGLGLALVGFVGRLKSRRFGRN